MSETIILNNRYKLEKSLGHGGMAIVYQALDQMLERTVAIKLLREDYSSDPDFRDRFHQEAKAAANLVHPNIVTVHDFGMDSGRLYIVMEYVPGTDLNTLLQKRGRFTAEETLSLMEQACAGIGYAHRAGLIHCDVKPHNLLITPGNRLKVTDFGIARALESIQPGEQNGVVWGSPHYFSPEQAAGKPPSPASDVYSLGIIMFYMLTGRLPFSAATAVEIARMHRHQEPPRPSQYNPSISPDLEAIILKVLSKETTQRYRTADQLGRVLAMLNKPHNLDTPSKPYRPAALTGETGQPTAISSVSGTRKAAFPEKQPEKLPASSSRPVQNFQPTLQPPVYRSRPEPQQLLDAPAGRQDSTSLDNPFDIDWISLGLGLLATLAVGGLIPLWVWVYLRYFTPGS
jgi:serine/threonine-protein kinase